MTLQRILYETVGRSFLRRLIAAFTGILLFALLADAVVDWNALRTEIAGSGFATRTALFTCAFVAWGVPAGRRLAGRKLSRFAIVNERRPHVVPA